MLMVLSFSILLLSSCISMSPDGTYTDREHGFQVQSPDGWDHRQDYEIYQLDTIITFISPGEDAIISLSFQSSDMDVEGAHDHIMSNTRELGDYDNIRVRDDGEDTIGGKEVFFIDYSFTESQDIMMARDVLVESDGRVFRIRLITQQDSFEEGEDELEKVMETLDFS